MLLQMQPVKGCHEDVKRGIRRESVWVSGRWKGWSLDDQPMGNAIAMKDIHSRRLLIHWHQIGPRFQWNGPDRLTHDVEEHQMNGSPRLHGQHIKDRIGEECPIRARIRHVDIYQCTGIFYFLPGGAVVGIQKDLRRIGGIVQIGADVGQFAIGQVLT